MTDGETVARDMVQAASEIEVARCYRYVIMEAPRKVGELRKSGERSKKGKVGEAKEVVVTLGKWKRHQAPLQDTSAAWRCGIDHS